MAHGKGVVGVYVRDDIVRILQFSFVKKRRIVHAMATVPIPQGIMDSGTVTDRERLGEVIRQACEYAQPHAIAPRTEAICALPESKTFIRIMSLPRVSEEQIAAAVQWEMEEYIPLPAEDVYYDWQRVPVLEHDEEQYAIVVVAAARTVVDGYIAALEYAQLRVVGIEADSIADARAVVDQDVQDGQMILFCGNTGSRLAIVVAGIPIFSVTVPVGYQTLIMNAVRAFGVSAKEAQRMIAADGIGSYIDRDPLFDAVLPSITALSSEVRKSANFCQQTLAQCKDVTSVLLCGKGATIKGLRSFLVREVGIAVYVADPWRNAVYADDALPPLSRMESLDAVTVIGLALRKLHYEDFD